MCPLGPEPNTSLLGEFPSTIHRIPSPVLHCRNLSSPGCWTTIRQSGPRPQNCSRASCCPRPRWRNRSCTRCCTTPWPTWTGRPTAPWWARSSPSASPLPSTTPTTVTYWRWGKPNSCSTTWRHKGAVWSYTFTNPSWLVMLWD